MFDASVLDIKSDCLVTKFITKISNVVASGKRLVFPLRQACRRCSQMTSNIAVFVCDIDYKSSESWFEERYVSGCYIGISYAWSNETVLLLAIFSWLELLDTMPCGAFLTHRTLR